MGPTIIVPGTQYRNAPTDRMSTYTNIKGQLPLTIKAGTVAFTHYDLWHGTAANRLNVKRHMIKFLFRRTRDNDTPNWIHDPECVNKPRDWNLKDKAEDPLKYPDLQQSAQQQGPSVSSAEQQPSEFSSAIRP